jgi:hypothetical protein
MEFAIPVTQFDPTKVRWGKPLSGPFKKIIPFAYEDNQVSFSSLNLVLDPLSVVYVDWDKNQLFLEEVSNVQVLAKIDQLQGILNSQIKRYYRDWLEGTDLPEQESILPLQAWFKSNQITLYLSNSPSSLPFFTENGNEILSNKTIKPGDLIRAVIRLQGISLQMLESGNWAGKSRIQHYVVELYKVSVSS